MILHKMVAIKLFASYVQSPEYHADSDLFHIFALCLLNFLLKWKVASSLKMIFGSRLWSFSLTNENFCKIQNELYCLADVNSGVRSYLVGFAILNYVCASTSWCCEQIFLRFYRQLPLTLIAGLSVLSLIKNAFLS